MSCLLGFEQNATFEVHTHTNLYKNSTHASPSSSTLYSCHLCIAFHLIGDDVELIPPEETVATLNACEASANFDHSQGKPRCIPIILKCISLSLSIKDDECAFKF